MLRRMLEGREEAEQAARSARAEALTAALAEVDAELAVPGGVVPPGWGLRVYPRRNASG